MPIAELTVGQIVLARAGEKIPVDGVIVAGSATINQAPITGESVPQDKTEAAQVFAGTIVEAGAIEIRTEKVGADTVFSRIIALVENAEAERAPVQKLADRVAGWLIPVVLVFLVGVFLVTHDVSKVVTLLIFTSPAELGLATPLVMIAAIARAASAGILIKGGLYLELLAKADAVVFDKTGTLTANKPEVVDVQSFDPAFPESALLRLVAAADRRSAHPLAKAVVDAAARQHISVPEPQAFEQSPGRGIKASVEGKTVLAGNPALLREAGVSLDQQPAEHTGSTPVHVAIDGKFAGVIFVADTLRPGAREAIAALKASGVKRVIMLTGDNFATAEGVARDLGVDEVRADLLPADKDAAIAELQRQRYKVAMVGDGVNDAPALARADIGIAMGCGGAQAALEAADIALMTDDLSKIVAARNIAQRAYRTIQENLWVGVGVVHALGITAALLGWIGPIQAAVLHLGPDVMVFLNSVKLLRVHIPGADQMGVMVRATDIAPQPRRRATAPPDNNNARSMLQKLSPLLAIAVGVVVALWFPQISVIVRSMFSDVASDPAPEEQAPQIASEGLVKLTAEQIEAAKIETVPAGPGTLTRHITVPAAVRPDPDRIGRVAAKVAGTVAELRKKLGDRVELNEVIAIVDSREVADAKSAYLAAAVQYDLQNQLFQREKGLFEKKITAEQLYLKAKTRFAEAKLAVDLARQKLAALDLSEQEIANLSSQPTSNLRRKEIRAPMAGRIIERLVALGQPVGDVQAQELYVISDLSVVEADLAVPVKYLAAVRAGQPVTLTAATGRAFEGKVAVVDAMISQETRAGRVIARFDNRDFQLRPGSLFNARIALVESRVGVRVPRVAVQTIGGQPSVFVRTDDGFVKRKVDTGAANDKFVEILSGVAPGEQVATKNAFILKADLGKKDFDPGL